MNSRLSKVWLLCTVLMMATVFAQTSDHDDDHHTPDHDEHDKSTTRMLQCLGITSLSGCAAMLGFCFIFCLNREQAGLIPVSLSFSGGVIVYLTFMNLIPESIEQFHRATNEKSESMAHFYTMLCIIGGLALSLSMERLIPHGHPAETVVAAEPQVVDLEMDERYESPISDNGQTSPNAKDPAPLRQASLPRVSYSVAMALILHHLPEGMAAFIALYYDLQFGILVSFALAIHDLPSGVCIALPTYLATGSKKKPFLLCLLAAFAYFLGGLLGWVIIVSATDQFVDSFVGVMFGITSGVMLYVAFVEILPTAIMSANHSRDVTAIPIGENRHHHAHNRVYVATIIGIFLGFLVMEIGNILLAESGGHGH